ncbi:hypothetical protein F5Y16DRAFT_401827 [Xylariaceae sp. FL0255]|nr:hypothetical protein F5Y16DRAFT_401827 [Xylariaceae sp. FL0255]
MVPRPSDFMIQRSDVFDPSWRDSLKDDGGAAVLLSSFEMLNLSFPSLTNEELALPNLVFTIEDEQAIQKSFNPNVSLRLPAMRGNLNCTITQIDGFSTDGEIMALTLHVYQCGARAQYDWSTGLCG